MYKWPQGRIVRVAALILAAVIAADLVYNGAVKGFGAWSANGATRQLVFGCVFVGLALAVALAGLLLAGFQRRAVDFLIEVEGEMTRVEWPKSNQLVRSTIIIAIAVAVLSGIIFLVDGGILWIIHHLKDLGKGF